MRPHNKNNSSLFGVFRSADNGNAMILFGLSVPALVGVAGLAIDVGQWELAHKSLQRAADSAAISGAVAASASGDILTTQGKAIAADYNFVDDGSSSTNCVNTCVQVNRPPQSGAYKGKAGYTEAIISQKQARIFSALFGSGKVAESARAVAVGNSNACILALDPSAAGAVSTQGNVSVTASGCSIFSNSNASNAVSAGGTSNMTALSIGAVGGVSGGPTNLTTSLGITTGSALLDPYCPNPSDATTCVNVPKFSGCDQTNFSSKTTQTISPGVYCSGFTLNAGANVTMSPGIYYMDQGAFKVNGSATLSGTGVTIIFTSSTGDNYATASINGGANINLTAPSTGPTAGIVLFGDRAMPSGTVFDLEGGANQVFSGATYIPKGQVKYAGGASSYNGCSQVIGDTVTFVGTANLAINCTGMGTRKVGHAPQLVE